MMYRHYRFCRSTACGLAATLLILGSCSTLQTNRVAYRRTSARIHTLPHPSPQPMIVNHRAPYLAGPSIRLRHELPAFFNRRIILVMSPSSLLSIASRISSITGIPVYVASSALQKLYQQVEFAQQSQSALTGSAPVPVGTPDTAPAAPNPIRGSGFHISVNWSGSLAHLLDYVASRAGVFWSYNRSTGSIRLFLTETRVYHVHALPGTMAIQSAISDTGTGAVGGGSGSSPGIANTTSQTVTSTSSVDLYKSIAADIKTILAQLSGSTGGGQIVTSVAADSAAGTVTVTATPPVLDQVATYVRALNRGLTRQAFITVYVYEVELNREDNYGLKLSLAYQNAGFDAGFTGTSPGLPQMIGSTPPGGLGMSVVSGPLAQSTALLQALSTQGKTSLVTSASVLALNGQPAPLQVATTTGYLYSSTVTQSANVGSEVSLQPGTVTTGFSASFLPMIMDHRKLLLEYAINLSDLLSLDTIASGGNEIQTPNVSTQAFAQRALLRSGQMLVLSGYESTSSTTDRSGVGSVDNPALGGGYDATHGRTVLVVAIKVAIL